MNLKIFCDGGARGNPGPGACAFVVKDPAGNIRYKCGKYLGRVTNNEAEYWAVIEALNWVVTEMKDPSNGIQEKKSESGDGTLDIHFYLDSTLVVNQINGRYKVKEPRLRELLFKIRELEPKIQNSQPTFSNVPRAENYLADQLVNETLDRQLGIHE